MSLLISTPTASTATASQSAPEAQAAGDAPKRQLPQPTQLWAFLGWALLLHLVALFLVDIVQPLSIPQPRPRASVQLGSLDQLPREARASAAFWRSMRDPARLIILPDPISQHDFRAMTGDEAFNQPTRPTAEPQPLPPAPRLVPSEVPALAQRIAASNQPQRLAYVLPSAPTPAARRTVVEYHGALRTRAHQPPPALPAPQVALLNETRPTVLSLGIDARGTVHQVLVRESSGNSGVDQQAVDAFRRHRFRPRQSNSDEALADEPLEWGRAAVYWAFDSAR